MRASLMLLTMLLAPVLAAAGDIYRWVDARGQVHYSQAPPAGSAQRVETRTLAQDSANPSLDSLHEYAEKRERERKLQAEQKAAAAEDKRYNVARCRVARERATIMENHPNMRVPDGQGELRPVTEEEHAAALADLRQAIKDNCAD
jgi:hypothetical protein